MEGTSHKSRFARVIKGRKGVEGLTMVLEEEADVCSIWLSITKFFIFFYPLKLKCSSTAVGLLSVSSVEMLKLYFEGTISTSF